MVNALVERGHAVTGLGHEPRPDWFPTEADWNQADLLNPDTLDSLSTDWRSVIHLAGNTVPSSFESDAAVQQNVDMTRNLLDRLEAARVLFASSALVYAPSRVPVTEASSLEPQGPYGLSKLKCEEVVATYGGWLDVRIARPFNHIGPGMQPKLAIPSIMRRVLEARSTDMPIEMLGQDSIRDFIDVRDVVSAYLAILELDSPEHGVFNVCTGRPTSIRTVVEAALAVLSIDRDIHFAQQAVSDDDASWLVGDPARIRDESGWAPKYSLEQSVRDMLAGY